MVAGIPKPERRLTKVRRTLSSKRPKSSGRSEREGRSRPASPQHLPTPLLTTCDDLRTSSLTRLQLREHFSSTFPDSDVSPLSDSTTAESAARRRPSTSSAAEPRPSISEDLQAIDVPAAIALLQELKKHASPDELVALHKALLPVRRSVDATTLTSPYDAESTTPDSRYTTNRRSTRYPGLATRGNDPLQTIEELEIKRRSYRDEKKRISQALEAAQDKHIVETSLPVPKSGNRARSGSSASTDDPNVGWYPAGTLRITNRDPSPSSVKLETQGDLPAPLKYFDGTNDLPVSRETPEPVQLKTSISMSGLPIHVEALSTAHDLPAQLKPSKSLTNLHEPTVRPAATLAMLQTDIAASTAHLPQQLGSTSSPSKVSRTPAMEEYSQFSGSPYESVTMSHANEEPNSPSASSCDSFKTSVEARPEQERARHLRETAERPPITSNLLATLAKYPRADGSMPPQQGDSGYASEESNDRQSHSLDHQRMEQDKLPTTRPITPKSPHSSIRTIRSRTTEEAYLPSSIDALPTAAHAFQRIEDIFVAPGDSRPPSRRQTLLSTFGIGRKSSESSRSAISLDLSSDLQRTKSGNGKKAKGPKKLQKTSSRKHKARKELAKFDPASQQPTIRPVSIIDEDPETDWYAQDEYYIPQVRAPNRLAMRSTSTDKWQPYQYDNRRYRNLSVVQEVDHDSLMDHSLGDRDEKLAYNSARSSRRSEPQYSECGDIPIGVSLLQPMHPNLALRRISTDRSEQTSRGSAHRVGQSHSSISSIASGQLDLIEEVQNATIDWAVQAKFWRARRTLVGQAFQQDRDHEEVEDDDQIHVTDETDLPGEAVEHAEDDMHTEGAELDEHDEHDFDNKTVNGEIPEHEDTAEETFYELPQRSYTRSLSRKSGDIEHNAIPNERKPRNTLVEAAFGSSGQMMSERLPVSELLGRRHMAMPGRFSGGLQYEWDRESGLMGSAGFNDHTGANNGRSLPTKMRYGVDLSDVPVFIPKTSMDRTRGSISVAGTN